VKTQYKTRHDYDLWGRYVKIPSTSTITNSTILVARKIVYGIVMSLVATMRSSLNIVELWIVLKQTIYNCNAVAYDISKMQDRT